MERVATWGVSRRWNASLTDGYDVMRCDAMRCVALRYSPPADASPYVCPLSVCLSVCLIDSVCAARKDGNFRATELGD